MHKRSVYRMSIQFPKTKIVSRSPSSLAHLPENTKDFSEAANYKKNTKTQGGISPIFVFEENRNCDLADICHFVSTCFSHFLNSCFTCFCS